MTTIKCPDCENGRVEVEVGRYFDGDYKTEYQDCETCNGSGEIEIKPGEMCVCGHYKNDHGGMANVCLANDECDCVWFVEQPSALEVIAAEKEEAEDEQPMCQGVFNRYDAERDAGLVTWADYQMAEAIVRLQSRIIKLEKTIDKLTELQF